MSFSYPWILILLIGLLLWILWELRHGVRVAGLLLKALAVAAVILALAEPELQFQQRKTAVAVLADTSASLTPVDLARASHVTTAIERSRGTHTVQIIPFARATRAPLASERVRDGWRLAYTPEEGGHGTNLESAIQEAIASLPAGQVRRVVLISDGNENAGAVTRAAWQAQQLGIPIDTFALAGRSQPSLRASSVSAPSQVFSGERFAVELTINSPAALHATVQLSADGRNLGENSVELHKGENQVTVRSRLNAAGAVGLSGKVSAPGAGELRFEKALTVRRPRVLFLSQDPPDSEQHLLKTLEANQFEVDHWSRPELPQRLDDYQLLVFNNWNFKSAPAEDMLRVEQFEQQGGGLLWIAGERNEYVEPKTGEDNPLERAFPAKLAPPRMPEGTCVILIIDKSSSMEGKKMELARMASIGVIDHLRPIDLVAVLIFDNSFQWAVPLRKAEDRSLIERLIAGITPDGGTQIAPALTEAYRKIVPVNAVYKHIVLLTDGISEEGDSLPLAREAANNRVTISTVGLGQDVNRAYLEKIAAFSKGKAYFLNEPSGLEQILLKDVQEHTGGTAVEKDSRAEVVKPSEVLEGVAIEQAPPLKGYVRFIARPSADTVLDIEQHDPLYVRWQYGLGRSAVFASDAKNRWAASWATWPGFDRFWTNVARDLLPHAPPSEATAQYDGASGELVVDYRLSRQADEPLVLPDLFVLGPNGLQKPMRVSKLASGIYRATGSIGENQGLFRVRPLRDSRAFPEIGFYRQESELDDYGSNESLLRQVAASTGGRFNPAPGDVFDSGGNSVAATMHLWPGLLAAAILLNLMELLLRKSKGILEALRTKCDIPASSPGF